MKMSSLKRICLTPAFLPRSVALGWFAAAQGMEVTAIGHGPMGVQLQTPSTGPPPQYQSRKETRAGSGRTLMQVFVHCAVNRSNRFTRQAGPLPVLGYCVSSIARPDGLKKGDWQGRLARWQAAYGQLNISTAPIAGCLTLRPRKSIRTSVPAVSIARFAGSRSTHGLAPMTSSAGRPIRRARPSLGKRSDRQASQTP